MACNNKAKNANESCADCAYHFCHKTCIRTERCFDGACLFTGKVHVPCYSQRCEHFKKWNNNNDKNS